MSAIGEALAWHNGDARAAIATLLADRAYLRWQLDLAGRRWAPLPRWLATEWRTAR